MELEDYLRALRNHWVGVLLIVLVACLVAFTVSSLRPPVYAADATGFVSTGQSENPALGTVNDSFAKSRATSYVDIAKSRATASQVIDGLDLDTTPSALARRVSVVQPPDTVLLKITARAGTPEDAQRLADAWVAAVADEVRSIEAPGTPADKLPDGTPRVIPIESAELPSSPESPQPVRDTLIGAALGLVLAFGYAMVRSTLDRRLRRPSDVTSRFTTPVVGEIPVAAALRPGPVDAVGRRAEETGPSGEAFRKLRTNLMYMDVDDPPRILVVTSPRAGDGKSTVAAHLTTALETTGQPVVLVDADLRRPTQAERFGLDPHIGLTSVLTGQLPLADALQEAQGRPGLRVLTAGPLPPNPSELLGSMTWRSVASELAEDAVVVIDAPPLLAVTDAAVLTKAADGAFVVISAGKTRDAELSDALGALEAVNARSLGVVLNRVRAKGRGYDDYRYYTAAAPDPVQETGGKRKRARARD